MLRSEIAGANLYLLNPSGVLFGPNASLDVSGSFHVSTADFLRFADGAKFSANLGQESVLTVAPPAAFGFLGNNPAPITIQGSTLQVPGGKALSVVGGDMRSWEWSAHGECPDARAPERPDAAGERGLAGGGGLQPPGAGAGSAGGRLCAPGPDGALAGGAPRCQRRRGRDRAPPGGPLAGRRHRVMFADNLGPMDGTGLGVDLRVGSGRRHANGHSSRRIAWEPAGRGILRLTAGSVHLDDSVIGSQVLQLKAMAETSRCEVGRLTLTGGAQISSGTRRALGAAGS